jgi:pilus assembly protein Flp/PilA
MRHLLARLSADRSGATAIEYGLIAAFIAVALVAALPSLRNNVMGLFENIDNKVEKARKQSNG